MTVEDGQRAHGPEQLSSYPEVDLDWAREDEGLTVFDPRPSQTIGSWIRIDSDACRSLERMR